MPSATAIHQRAGRATRQPAKKSRQSTEAVRERLRELIKGSFPSVEKFAEHIGVSQSTVASWFGERRSAPRADTLMLIASRTGWSVDELLGTNGSAGLASELRAYLVRRISDRAPGTSPETVLPPEATLLADLVERYQELVMKASRDAIATLRAGEIDSARYKLRKARTVGALRLLARLEEVTAKGESEVALPELARERRQAILALIGPDPKARELAREFGADAFIGLWFRHLKFIG